MLSRYQLRFHVNITEGVFPVEKYVETLEHNWRGAFRTYFLRVKRNNRLELSSQMASRIPMAKTNLVTPL